MHFAYPLSLQFWRMEFLQVPETPAPEPVEMLEMQEDCQEAQIGMSPDKCFVFAFYVIFTTCRLKSYGYTVQNGRWRLCLKRQ